MIEQIEIYKIAVNKKFRNKGYGTNLINIIKGGFIMLIAALIIYIVLTLITGPLWPLDYISGKAGCLGQIIVIIWGALIIGGLST